MKSHCKFSSDHIAKQSSACTPCLSEIHSLSVRDLLEQSRVCGVFWYVANTGSVCFIILSAACVNFYKISKIVNKYQW